MTESPWQVKKRMDDAFEIAERNGFTLRPGSGGFTEIIAAKRPYAKNCVIKTVAQWTDVAMFFSGYEQHELEARSGEKKP